MRIVLLGAVVAALAAGCGEAVKPNASPMSEEEIRKMKEDDRQIDDSERSGSGSATGKPARR